MALTVRSANSLMEVYGNAGRIDDAMAVFDRMCLAACTNAAAAAVPASTASAAPRTTSTSTAPSSSPPSIWPAPDMITYTVAVHLLSNAGRLSEAEATFDAMLVAGMQPDAVAWSTMVLMWAREGNPSARPCGSSAWCLPGARPMQSAYNALLLAFVSVGMFEEAEEVLSAFKNGWDLVGQVDLSGEKHTGFGKRRPDQASGPTDDPWRAIPAFGQVRQ
ncbi:hypothetical protein CLOM_g1089 [Closterium sp. NIES-68]|nr:hypothetical protein CLOM_g1089 [Closterium sp. NIES-68]